MKSAQNTILQKGFTLIELLVVIGILGILATALVATIDPFEQLKKASDSNLKNAAVEFANANLRYYTTHNAMPWHATGGVAGCGTAGVISAVALDAATGAPCVTGLIQDGELKNQFDDDDNLTSKILLTGDATTEVNVCYLPTSKSEQRSPLTKFDSTGTERAAGLCGVNGTDADNCYWCAAL